jgi:hypothetical protein
MTNPTVTYSATLRCGTIELEHFTHPAIAPKPQGYEYPLRTVAEVKSWLRLQARTYGWRKALPEINLVTKDDLLRNRSIMFG